MVLFLEKKRIGTASDTSDFTGSLGACSPKGRGFGVGTSFEFFVLVLMSGASLFY